MSEQTEHMDAIEKNFEIITETLVEIIKNSSLQVLGDIEKHLQGQIKVFNSDDLDSPIFNDGIRAALTTIKIYRESVILEGKNNEVKPTVVRDDDENYTEF